MTDTPRITDPAFEPAEGGFTDQPGMAIDDAFTAARESGKRVLIRLAANWCPDSRAMSGMLQMPEMKSFLEDAYETVTIDVGRYDLNMDIPPLYGLADWEGLPTLMILTAEGELLNGDEPSIFRNARARHPQEIVDYLYRYSGR